MQKNLSHKTNGFALFTTCFFITCFFATVFFANAQANETSSKSCQESVKSLLDLEFLDFEGGDIKLLKTLFVSRARKFLEAPSLEAKTDKNLQQELQSVLKRMLRLHEKFSNSVPDKKEIFRDQTFEDSILKLAKIFFESQGTSFSLEEARDPETKKNYLRGVIHPSAGFFGALATTIQNHYHAKLLWDIRHLRFLQAEAAYDPEGIVYLGRHILSDRAKSLTSSLWHEIDHAHIDRLNQAGVLLPIHGHLIQPLLPVAEAYSIGFDLAELRTLAKDASRVMAAIRKDGGSQTAIDTHFSLLRHPLEDLVSFSKNWLESLRFFEKLFSEVNKASIEVSEKSIAEDSRQIRFLSGLVENRGSLLDVRIRSSDNFLHSEPVVAIQLRYSMDIKKVLELGISPQRFKRNLLGHSLHFSMYGDLSSDIVSLEKIQSHIKSLKSVALQSVKAAEAALNVFQEYEALLISSEELRPKVYEERSKKWELLEKKIQELPIYSLTTDELKKFHQNRRALK